MTSLASASLCVVMEDDFEDPSGSAGRWQTRQGASTASGHTGLGWSLSAGAGGFALPVAIYQHPVGVTVLGARYWLKVSPLVTADWMVWENATAFQVLSNIYSDGSVDLRRGGSALGSSAPGVILDNTWQYHDVRVRCSDTTGAVWWQVDGTTVIDVDGVDSHASGSVDYTRLVFSIASSLTTLIDDVEVFVACGWRVGSIGF